MKKIICCFLSLVLIICTFTACVNNSKSKGNNVVVLTPDNASDYFTFHINGGGADFDNISSNICYSVQFNGTITGLAGYTYNDVEIEITCYYDLQTTSCKGSCTLSDTTTLNLGGNGNVNASERIYRRTTLFDKCVVNCTGYEVTSITGTVTIN